jgi:hypothetical protein
LKLFAGKHRGIRRSINTLMKIVSEIRAAFVVPVLISAPGPTAPGQDVRMRLPGSKARSITFRQCTGEWVTYLSSGEIAERKPHYTNFLTSR